LPDVICNTSPIQYLYQLELLHILRALAGGVIVPPAVVDELAEGRALGVNLPDLTALDWVTVRRPVSELAETLGLRLTGTLGLLLDAKSAGLIPAVGPFLSRLQALHFRVAPHTRAAVLKLAGEWTPERWQEVLEQIYGTGRFS
jgi:predicted nucleic acid-binding protein